jgi:hypothetical protein
MHLYGRRSGKEGVGTITRNSGKIVGLVARAMVSSDRLMTPRSVHEDITQNTHPYKIPPTRMHSHPRRCRQHYTPTKQPATAYTRVSNSQQHQYPGNNYLALPYIHAASNNNTYLHNSQQHYTPTQQPATPHLHATASNTIRLLTYQHASNTTYSGHLPAF